MTFLGVTGLLGFLEFTFFEQAHFVLQFKGKKSPFV